VALRSRQRSEVEYSWAPFNRGAVFYRLIQDEGQGNRVNYSELRKRMSSEKSRRVGKLVSIQRRA